MSRTSIVVLVVVGITVVVALAAAVVVCAVGGYLWWATAAPPQRAEVDTLRARTAVTLGAISGAQGCLAQFRADVGRYPTAEEGLAALWTMPADPVEAGRWGGPYVESADVFRDGWARPLRYLPPAPGAKPVVYSVGPDGVDDGNQGDDIAPAVP